MGLNIWQKIYIRKKDTCETSRNKLQFLKQIKDQIPVFDALFDNKLYAWAKNTYIQSGSTGSSFVTHFQVVIYKF